MTRLVRTALALGVLVFAVTSLSVWPAAGGQGTSFYVDCDFSAVDGVLRVRINDEGGLVRRSGDEIRVLAPTGAPGYEAIDCGDTATVNNTDLIRLTIDSVAHGITSGLLSLRRGPFAPGRTPESGEPEIEILTFARDSYEDLGIEGTQHNNHFRAGRLDGADWVNLNPYAESASPDADLKLPSVRAPVGFLMGRGKDTVTVNGGPEFTRPLGARDVFVDLGRGADYYRARHPRSVIFDGRGWDTIVTGRRRDVVFELDGRDSIRARGGRDFVIAVGGKDRVLAGKGRDVVIAQDGRRDRVHCGPGLDRAALDKRDRARSCERDFDLSKSTAAKGELGAILPGVRDPRVAKWLNSAGAGDRWPAQIRALIP